MALPTFYFKASLPADRASLEPLAPLLVEILRYTGYSEVQSRAMAAAIDADVRKGLTAAASGSVTVVFEKDGPRLTISLHAPHLPKSRRYEHRVPEAS